MFNLPYVPTAEELIDKAFRKGSEAAKAKRSTRKAPREIRLRKSEEVRVETTGKKIQSDLKAIIKNFPSYEQLPEFYKELLNIKVEKDRYKKSLGAVQWCLKRIEELQKKNLREIKSKGDTMPAIEFLGRSASLVKQISNDLDELILIKKILKDFPTVEDLPTLVIAGYPNSGKSTFMRNLTGSKVKVASYPFTTQSILTGHKIWKYQRYQIIDLPGLLDREMEKRNKIELQAILAMKELADVILFLIDPTIDIKPQISIFREIKNNFNSRLFVAINKIDIADKKEVEKIANKLKEFFPMKICAKNKEDCEKVFEKIFKIS